MSETYDLGKWGERVAAEYLHTQGYSIMTQRFHSGKFELDIVAMDGNELVFVEVKTRHDDFIDPVDAITDKKIAYLARAADHYLTMNPLPHSPRFDVITIVGTPEGGYELKHYKDAFEPPLDAL